MWHDSAIACTSNVREGLRDQKGDKGTDFVSALQLRAREAKFKSLASILINLYLKANFKIPFTPKN